MKYKVSQELIEILLKNGFREVTQKTYPEHYAKLLKNGYNPDSIKRHFAFKKNSHWVAYIKFDYTYIQILHDTPCLQEMLYAIDENQLKSVFTFFKMPAVKEENLITLV